MVQECKSQQVTTVIPEKIILLDTSTPGKPIYTITNPVISINSNRPKHSRKPINTSIIIKNYCNHGDLSKSRLIITPTKSSSIPIAKERKKYPGSLKLERIKKFCSLFSHPIDVHKLIKFLAELSENRPKRTKMNNTVVQDPNQTVTLNDTIVEVVQSDNIEEHKKVEVVTSNVITEENKRLKMTRNLEFSTITTSSFQRANSSTEVEFCRNSSDIQICQASQSDEQEPTSDCNPETEKFSDDNQTKDCSDDGNNFSTTSTKSDLRPTQKKKMSHAERKKNKLRNDFLANLSLATPSDPEIEKHRNEMFAVAYYEKLCDGLANKDYQKIMQVLSNFESGDVVDLYNEVQGILLPNYPELAEDFLFFLKEKEASAVGQLIPWMELQTRVKFLRKLEIYLQNQPFELKKVYDTLIELTKIENLSMEKIKTVFLPLLKGNKILLDLFLQNFRNERPPESLLEGPYETIDLSKEMARPDNEELFETFVVPNTEDKYGGPNCICHCHRIEDNEYKARSKHCNACGLKFANGKPYLTAGRLCQPATISFKTNPHIDHNIRLMGKVNANVLTGHKKKRSDSSPSKAASSSTKDNLGDDTEDDEQGKRKRSISQKSPRKHKKRKLKENCKHTTPKKSLGRNPETAENVKVSVKPRKRTLSGKKSKKEETITKNNVETEIESDNLVIAEIQPEKIVEEEEVIVESVDSEQETGEEPQEKGAEEYMDSSGESLEKPLTHGQQQTAESETEVYLEEESSQDNYATDDSSTSTESMKDSQSDCNTNDELAWQREEDTVILETLQKEDDKEYALQIISDKLPNRTIGQIRTRLSRLMDLLIETLKHS